MPRDRITYHEENDVKQTLKLREVLSSMPPFVKDYFRGIEPTTTTRTRISYAYDIRIFFQFLLDENPYFKSHLLTDFKVSDLDLIKALDIEEYMEYLKVYKDPQDDLKTNGERGLKRKMSALRSFYAYYYKKEI